MTTTDKPAALRLIGVPLDLGAGRRGVDMGPSALRIAGITRTLEEMGYLVVDVGNIEVPQRETLEVGDRELRYLAPIAEVCESLYCATLEALEANSLPIALGGDHSLAVGSVAAAADFARSRGQRLGLIWLDAHGDMNSAVTSPSGNIHGMPLSCLLGDGAPQLANIAARQPALDPDDVVLLGVRAIDAAEASVIRAAGIKTMTMRDLDSVGMRQVVAESLEHLQDCAYLHISFDVDFLDPGIAPGVGTRVRGGPSYREAHLAMELLADSGRVRSVDVVEVNPCLDRENATAELAVELLASLFGKRIL
ncbi:MAG: arginase [Rickettsiales bacterium]|nr:arginase [Rickettsiales bacterium]|tara:strand:- start:1808 stop:2731 length:924 start_codon:yes stop_codon:yes gene_type:complete